MKTDLKTVSRSARPTCASPSPLRAAEPRACSRECPPGQAWRWEPNTRGDSPALALVWRGWDWQGLSEGTAEGGIPWAVSPRASPGDE